MNDDESGKRDDAPLPPLDPILFESPEMRAALAGHDIATVYRRLERAGISQHQLARRTGQSQSEVCEIRKGRKVGMYEVLVRICRGLGLAREAMGLSYGPGGAYAGAVVDPREGVCEAMRRRSVIGSLGLAVFGTPLLRRGEQLAGLALPSEQALPSRLTMTHVRVVAAAVEQLRSMARQFGGMAGEFGDAARCYTRWLAAPGDDAVKAALGAALSELHTEAGWCCYDSGLNGLGYVNRAVELADEFGDGFGVVNAAWHAGMVLRRSGHPDDALKCYQTGQVQLAGGWPGKPTAATLHTDDPRVPILTARLHVNSAGAYAAMGDPARARYCLAASRDGWAPRDAFEWADMDLATAGIQRQLGHLNAAAQFAQAALRTFDAAHGRGRALADIELATAYVRAGEPRGMALADKAIDGAACLRSAVIRNDRLSPLTAALDARPGGDARDLARKARQVAATGTV